MQAQRRRHCNSRAAEQQSCGAAPPLAHPCFVACPALQVWLAPLKAILPGVGLPVSAWALWQEEARGITAQGLARARVDALTVDLLGRRLNRTQVRRARGRERGGQWLHCPAAQRALGGKGKQAGGQTGREVGGRAHGWAP